jgi:hypothetical protein
MRRHISITLVCVLLAATTAAGQGFVTTTFGNSPKCQHPNTLKVVGSVLRFDLSALPKDTVVHRAVLSVSGRGHRRGVSVVLYPVGWSKGHLQTRPPLHRSFDATAAVRAWVKDPARNGGLKVASSGGLRFDGAVLAVSYAGKVAEAAAKPATTVTELKAIHQSGQTFLTWKEIDDPIGEDAPKFEDFEKRIIEARKQRSLRYRVYRHTKPITAGTLGDAEMVQEVEDIVSVWNLLQIRNTEHPNQGTPTKRSFIRGGKNLALNHVMRRYRIVDGSAEPLSRATGLAVVTVQKPGKRYYAVTTVVHGAEAVAKLDGGCSLAKAVDETPSKFPAAILLRSSIQKGKRGCDVHVYGSWVGPPYNNLPQKSETFVVRWKNLPKGDDKNRLPLLVLTSTYGGSATELGGSGWHNARTHVPGSLRVGVTEGGVWQGFHECMGTLRGYDRGVVHNYPQRRVLGAAHWAMWKKDLFVDPQRVYFWSQLGCWALRHGDVFAVVMSNGYGNPNIGRLYQKHGWKWGPYPKSSQNFAGVKQWDYMNMARYVRDNPTVELPFWICFPAYGAYPSHTIGDFGFEPWPEMIHAMASTKRAFAANWSSNGSGSVRPLMYAMVSKIKRDQSLPAFTNCSLDHSPGDGNHADAQKGGGINVYQRWDTATIVDEPDEWAMTMWLGADLACTTDVTPRRCQKFKAKSGETFKWTNTLGGKVVQSGAVTADKWGLVTLEKVRVTKAKARLVITRDK